MQNDVIATGIMSFAMHEMVYFGRALPWIIIGQIPYFHKYKIQNVCYAALARGICLVAHVCTAKNTYRSRAMGVCSICAPNPLYRRDPSDMVRYGSLAFVDKTDRSRLFHPMAHYFGMDTGVPFPSLLTMALQIAVFFVMEDAGHYWLHRALHWGPLYKNIHKIHHQYSAPFGLAAEYASPIEVMLLGIPTIGSPILWCAITGNLHILTMYAWIVLRLFQAIDAHSGYEFPWSLHHFLPGWGGAQWHDVHHEKFIGNYSSSFRWWDKMMDTESGPEAAKKRRERRLAKMGKAGKKAQ